MHTLNRRDLLATGSAGLAAALSGCATSSLKSAKSAARWPAVTAFLKDGVDTGKFAGAEVAIGRTGSPVQYFGAGKMAFGDAPAVSPDTLWRIYSMTKPISGMAGMLLVEDGKIKLDQNIADFIPAFANPEVLIDPAKGLDSRPAKSPITVRNLLTHTSGLVYGIFMKGPIAEAYAKAGLNPSQTDLASEAGANRPPTLEAFANAAAALPLMVDPGTQWIYSMSLDILGRVIEVASGLPFDTFLQRRIFSPLDMADTFFQVPENKLDRLSTNYIADATGFKVSDPGRPSVYAQKPTFPYGGAGLVSSARDYARFLAMLAGGGKLENTRIMKSATADLAMSNLMPASAAGNALGIPVSSFGAGGIVAPADVPGGVGKGTYGWAGAAGTQAWVDRVRGVHVTFMVQKMWGPVDEYRKPLEAAVYADLAAL